MNLKSRVWLLLSQAVNTLVFKGDPDESLSARCYREGKEALIDRWLGKDHCKEVYEAHKLREMARK